VKFLGTLKDQLMDGHFTAIKPFVDKVCRMLQRMWALPQEYECKEVLWRMAPRPIEVSRNAGLGQLIGTLSGWQAVLLCWPHFLDF